MPFTWQVTSSLWVASMAARRKESNFVEVTIVPMRAERHATAIIIRHQEMSGPQLDAFRNVLKAVKALRDTQKYPH